MVGDGEVAADVVQMGRCDVVSSASGGASALKGRPWIIVSAARSRSRSFAKATVGLLEVLVVGVLEAGVAVLVEGADALDPVRMDR